MVVSEEELREAFREAGKRVHPDAGGDEESFAELQRAFGVLASPSRRLRHWLELQGVEVAARGSVSDAVSDLFGVVGGVIQAAGEVSRRIESASSALALAMLEDESQRSREAVERAIGQVEAAIGGECAKFPGIETATGAREMPPDVEAGMEGLPAEALAEAGETVRTLAFLEKWRAELRGCYAKLAAPI